jgi:hypothetical protein
MATTTNYGWTTPNDTDLVKDGASAIRSLGQSIDTTFAELKGGTSGQMLTKASNADLDLVWVTPEIGDITSITATSPLTGGGTTGAVTVGIQAGSTTQSGALQLTDSTSSTSTTTAATPNSVKTSFDLATAAIPKSTVTTAGDVIYATGSSTVTRLGIGSTGQVLTVAGGVPSWAAAGGGGMTSIASGSMSGATVNLSSIAGTYNALRLVVFNWGPVSVNNNLLLQFNTDTGTTYVSEVGYTLAADSNANASSIRMTGGTATTSNGIIVTDIPNYASSLPYKYATIGGLTTPGSGGTATRSAFVNGFWNNTAAITSIQLKVSGGGNHNAGTYILYGVK